VELATEAEALAGTDTTLAITPATLDAVAIKSSRISLGAATYTATTSGAGASTTQGGNRRAVASPTTATGYGSLYFNFLLLPRLTYNANIDWSKRVEFEFLFIKGVITTDANTVCRVKLGQAAFSGVAGDLSAKGIGIRMGGTGNVYLMVHDGTTLTTVDSGIAVSSSMQNIFKIVSDGAGNVTFYSNGSSVATTTAGPTTQGGGNGVIFEAQNTATISTTPMQASIANLTADFGY